MTLVLILPRYEDLEKCNVIDKATISIERRTTRAAK